MEELGGEVAVGREGIGAEAGTAAEVGREEFAEEFAGQAVLADVVIFERDGIEVAGNGVAFVFWRSEGRGI